MRVLLMRHSIAVDPYDAPTDESRWLTSEGRARARAIAAALRPRVQLTHALASPLVRAMQTADLMCEGLGYEGELVTHAALAVEHGTTAQALAPLDDMPHDAVVLMVTHAPKVRVLASHLSQREDIPSFRTGSALCVDIAKDDRRSIVFSLEPSPLVVHENDFSR